MQEDPSLFFLFGSLIILLIVSAFFSGSETGMMAANKIKLRNLSKKRHRGAKRALKLLKKPDLLLSTILVGNNFANIFFCSVSMARVSPAASRSAKPSMFAALQLANKKAIQRMAVNLIVMAVSS